MKFLLFFVFSLFLNFICFSQKLDLLKSDIKKEMHDTNRLKILAQLVELEEDGIWKKYNQERKNIA